MRQCCQCRVYKDDCDFNKRNRRKGGLRYECRRCQSRYRRDWYLRNAAQQIAAAKAYRVANPEKMSEWEAARRTDPVRANARKLARREHRLKHYHEQRAQTIERVTEWRRRHPLRVASYNAKCRTKRREVGMMALGDSEWNELRAAFGHRCAYCLQPSSTAGRLEIEHVMPLSRGGRHELDNIVPACRACNARKYNKTLLQLVMEGREHVGIA